jgi:hypothetical protein
MKRLLSLLILLTAFGYHVFACEIKVGVQEKSKKETYSVGDEVVIEVQVQLTHRHCHLEIQKTKFTYENLKIVGATDWKEVKPGCYTRQVKATVTGEKGGVAKLTIDRKCDEEGGYAVCTLKKG